MAKLTSSHLKSQGMDMVPTNAIVESNLQELQQILTKITITKLVAQNMGLHKLNAELQDVETTLLGWANLKTEYWFQMVPSRPPKLQMDIASAICKPIVLRMSKEEGGEGSN